MPSSLDVKSKTKLFTVPCYCPQDLISFHQTMTRISHLLVLMQLLMRTLATSQCVDVDGNVVADAVPCYSTSPSFCCSPGFVCLSNLLCSRSDGFLIQGSCTSFGEYNPIGSPCLAICGRTWNPLTSPVPSTSTRETRVSDRMLRNFLVNPTQGLKSCGNDFYCCAGDNTCECGTEGAFEISAGVPIATIPTAAATSSTFSTQSSAVTSSTVSSTSSVTTSSSTLVSISIFFPRCVGHG
jgi:hypothetical protein